MESETRVNQNQKGSMLNASEIDGQSCSNQTEVFGRNAEKASTKEAYLGISDSNHPGEHGRSTIPMSDPFNTPCRQPLASEMALKLGSVDHLCNAPWRSPSSSDLASVSDVIDRRMSFESTDSEEPFLSTDNAPSLDDVFDVLDAEMDFFRSDVAKIAPDLTMPSTQFMNDIYQLTWSNGSYQPPNAYIPTSNPCNVFQGFNFGLVKGLQNPSRGLITAVRRLCDLLSKPRSDHLDSIFVRLLNETLKEMEDAARPQSKRPRRNSAMRAIPYKQRKRANKSASDVEGSLEAANIKQIHSLTSKSQSLSVISSTVAPCTETVDLTVSDNGQKANAQQADSKGVTQKEPFIALEDTMPVFLRSLISYS